MCFTGPSTPAAPVQQVAAPAQPAQTPRAPEIAAGDTNKRQIASTQRQGTSIFRNDLSIPSSGATGTGINIPK